MKRLLILGGGTAGTMVANRLCRRLDDDWSITVVDPDPVHLYQPGLLFLPFGATDEAKLRRPRQRTLHGSVAWVRQAVDHIDVQAQRVKLAKEATTLPYDLAVLATGARLRPELTAGLTEQGWGVTTHEFYTLQGALALREALARFEGGRLVVNVVEMPIKCPVAPLEFLFLADDYFRRRGNRERVELVYVTPLDGAFTRPVASRVLGGLLERKGIRVETDFSTGQVDGQRGVLRSYDEREVPFDLLVSIPTHSGAAFVAASGLGNELDFVPTDRATLQVQGQPRLFALGDATDLPTSKAGSVAHFQSETIEHNVIAMSRDQPLAQSFDGHANCFVETGGGKALLIDFSYDVEPLPGRYPLGTLGPMTLLRESRLNHVGKLAFRWIYWNALLPGRSMPIESRFSMRGKQPMART